MKVPGSEASDATFNRIQGASTERVATPKGQAAAAQADNNSASQRTKAEDTMQFSPLSALLKSELSPAKMADERRARIETLKEQIKNGTYAPPSEVIAQAVGEELSLEILLSAGALNDAE